MQVFQEIPEGLVITFSRGIYRQVKLFTRGRYVFAEHGNGFVRLYSHGATSVPSVTWKDLDPREAHLTENSFALQVADPQAFKPIPSKPALAAE